MSRFRRGRRSFLAPRRAPRGSARCAYALALAGLVACGEADATRDDDPGAAGAHRPVDAPPEGPRPPGMVWVPAGTFLMGSDDAHAQPDERMRVEVRLSGFWMDATEVTNARFDEFTRATGYVTTAERAPTLDEIMAQLPPGTEPPPPEVLVPGSLVFVAPPPGRPVPELSWWHWTPGADWRHPHGPGDSLEGKGNHPVVHVSWDDARAYCAWAGKRLPTEAEFEYAARGGRAPSAFAWGDEPTLDGRWVANVHQGSFPSVDDGSDGFVGSAPVARFPANAYGLFDLAGNVWEWTSDYYRADRRWALPGPVVDPTGPESGLDPDEPTVPKRVTKGGSFLCSVTYCTGFRPSARMKTSPDTGLVHTGFRGVMSQAMWEAVQGRQR